MEKTRSARARALFEIARTWPTVSLVMACGSSLNLGFRVGVEDLGSRAGGLRM